MRTITTVGAAAALVCSFLLAAPPAFAADGDATCLGCHGQAGLTKTFAKGDTLALHVEGKAFEGSAHAPVGCSACHSAIDLKTHPAKTRSFDSARAYTAAASDACRNCHDGVFAAYEKSRHAKAQGTNPAAPLCADCHNPHEVKPSAAASLGKDACLTCHAGVEDKHEKWLPNTAQHFEVVSCAACHAPLAPKKVDLRLYDTVQNKEITGKESVIPAGAPLDEQHLWGIVRNASTQGKVTLMGRVEVANGADAHALLDKGKAVNDCTTCHRKGAEPFQNVTFSTVGPDGRRVRYEARKEVLHAPTSVDSMRGFYAIGGTRIQILDILLALALVGGISAPIAHLVMRRLSRRNGKTQEGHHD
jgi:hypothetical protein